MFYKNTGNLREGAIYKDRARSVVRLERADADSCEYRVIRHPDSNECGKILLVEKKEFFWNAFVLLADCESDWLSVEENYTAEFWPVIPPETKTQAETNPPQGTI